MVLSGVGDALGFRWEFEYSGPQIHQVGKHDIQFMSISNYIQRAECAFDFSLS